MTHARHICLTGKVKKKSARSLLNGALVRSSATQQLAQITFGEENRRGHRELQFQVLSFVLSLNTVHVHCSVNQDHL